MIQVLTCVVLLIASSSFLYGQVGGDRSYEFLNVPYTAKISQLGGVNVSLVDQDVNLFLSNPALIGDTLSGYASANYLLYFAGIGLATFAYARKVDQIGGMLSVGIQHIDLGSIDGYDASGNITQPLSSRETAITLSHARQSGNFRMGINMRWVHSNIANYGSDVLLFDFGGVFVSPDKQFNIGMVIKSIGFVLNDYTDESNSKLPIDIQIGTSIKPKHMPFRFSITAYQFVNGGRDVAYYEPSNGLQTDAPGGFDKVMRHFVIGTELLLGKNVNIGLGYNHLVRKELSLESKSGGEGISYGLVLRVKAIEFAYSRGGYHAVGGTNHFTLTFNTNKILRRAKKN